ncbi:hypothetical protein [Streptomyces rochei]|uniref:hypothetical protein n=1 Tax=Streptomyces rochei TaxID=1928 RepID=UPI0033C2E1C9
MTHGENRELAFTPPDVPLGIIPALGGGETCITTQVDVRLCASLLIAVLTLVAVVVLLIAAWPAVEEVAGLWPCLVSLVLGLLGLSRRSYLRVIRFRRA